jgi:hypothetical protein
MILKRPTPHVKYLFTFKTISCSDHTDLIVHSCSRHKVKYTFNYFRTTKSNVQSPYTTCVGPRTSSLAHLSYKQHVNYPMFEITWSWFWECQNLRFSSRHWLLGPWAQENEEFEIQTSVRCQWLTPVILATQEAEIRRIMVQSQPRTNSSQDPISKNQSQKMGWQWLKW